MRSKQRLCPIGQLWTPFPRNCDRFVRAFRDGLEWAVQGSGAGRGLIVDEMKSLAVIDSHAGLQNDLRCTAWHLGLTAGCVPYTRFVLHASSSKNRTVD